MAPLKFIFLALAAASVKLVSAAEDDGCTYITDCAGSVEIALGKSCTSSYGDAGKIKASVSGLPAEVCLQCPGTGSVDLKKFPYFVCNSKPICGHVDVLGKSIDIKPNQAKCIWENPNGILDCLGSCTPNAPGPAPGPTTAPAPGPTTAPAPGPTTAPAPGPSTANPSLPSQPGSSAAPSKNPNPPKDGVNCGPGELPVSVEGGQTGCAAVPICVGGFPNGNCPADSHCGIVKTGVPGCKLGAGSSTSAPSSGPSSGPSTGPSSGPSSSAPGPSSSSPAYKCNANAATPADKCGGKIVLADSEPAGCSAKFQVGAKVGCIQCSEGFKVDESDANSCFAYCGSKPLCGSVSSFNLTPKQMTCIVKNPNSPLGCLAR